MESAKRFEFAQEKYVELRKLIYKKTQEYYGGSLRVAAITQKALLAADSWSSPDVGGNRGFRATWDWQTMHRKYLKEPSRFEISVWAGGELCALSLGKTSRQKKRVRLDLIESTPVRPSPLGMGAFQVISLAATMYAKVIGAEEICILDPVNYEVSSYYQKFGYSAPEIYSKGRLSQRLKL